MFQGFGGEFHPAPAAGPVAQAKSGHEGQPGHHAVAEFLHDAVHVIVVNEGGKALAEQFLGAVAEDFVVVGADVGVSPVLGNLADEIQRVFGDDPVMLLLVERGIARLAQGLVLPEQGEVSGPQTLQLRLEFVLGKGRKVHRRWHDRKTAAGSPSQIRANIGVRLCLAKSRARRQPNPR